MPRVWLISNFIPCSSFYYVNFLLEQEPEEIIDLGCGPNFFKDIIPGVVGIDPVGEWADITDMFDDEFLKGHYESFASVLSIDALHFLPITQFVDRVEQFYSTIKPGGRGYLSLNAKRMVEFSMHKAEELFGTPSPTAKQTQEYVCNAIDTQLQHIDFLVCDVMITEKFDEMIDGNIRIVMQKPFE